MCKGSQTTTSNQSYSPNPQALNAYSSLLSQAQGVAANPYVPYTGELVAPVNAQENTGIGGINQFSQFALPSIQSGLNLAQSAATPISAAQIQRYESPFTQQVVNATQAQFNNQNAQQAQGINSNAIAQGAMGGNRVGIAQAELANQQQLAQAPVIANLEQQGYTTGLNTALTEQQAQLMGAYGLAGIGSSGQGALLSGAGQQVGAGQLQQGTQQALDTALMQQYLTQQAYPFQTSQWLAGIEGALGPQMGGSGASSTTGPPPSLISQLAGLGTLGTGLFGSTGAVAGLGSLGSAIGTGLGSLGTSLASVLPFLAVAKGGRVNAHRKGGGIVGRAFGGGMEGPPMALPMASGSGGVTGGMQFAPSTPYAAASAASYVPQGQLMPAYPFSWRLPNPPGVSNANNQPINAQGVAQLGKAIFGSVKSPTQTSSGVVPTPVGAYSPAGMAPEVSPSPSMDAGPSYMSDAAVYRRGGGVRYRDDGGGLDSDQPPALAQGDDQPPPSDQPLSLVPSNPSPAPSGPTGVVGPPLAFVGTPNSSNDSLASFEHNPDAYASSISGLEQDSRGYGSLGPVVRSGDRGYGKYQVMGNNIGPWTNEVLGHSMSPQEFLNDPAAQDAVFKSKFGQYVSQYGPEGAARAWIGGPGNVNNPNAVAHDQNGNPIGLTVGDYGRQFTKNLGMPSGIAMPPGTDTQQQSQGPTGVAGPPGALQKLFPNVDFSANSKLWPALIAAGAGMLSSRSPFPGVAIGEGAAAGLNEYQAETAAQTNTQLKQAEINQNSRKLQMEVDKMALDYQFRLKTLEQNNEKEQREAQLPHVLKTTSPAGFDTSTTVSWNPVTKSYQPYDPISGTFIQSGSNTSPSSSVAPPSPSAVPSSSTPTQVPSSSGAVPPTPPQASPTPVPVATPPIPHPATGLNGPVGPTPPQGKPPIPAQATPPVLTGPGGPVASTRPLDPANPVPPPVPPMPQSPATAAPSAGLPHGLTPADVAGIPPTALNVAGMIANYQMPPLSGYALRSQSGLSIMGLVKKINPDWDARNYNTSQAAYTAYASGPLGQKVVFFNNAIQHEATLAQLIKGLQNGSTPAINAIRQWYQQETGQSAPTVFDAAKQLVINEVIKSVTATGGGVTDRAEATENIQKRNSPQQLLGAIKVYQDLGGAQLRDLWRNYRQSTMRTDFDKWLTPESKTAFKQYMTEQAQNQSAAKTLPTYNNIAEVRQLMASGQLMPGESFVGGDGKVHMVPIP